jgi:hypothetical protein
MTTPVIFRKLRDGDVVALLPTLPGTENIDTCNSYMHIGQHSPASLAIIEDTKPAKPKEYRDLLTELISLGHDDLKIYVRYQRWMMEKRVQAMKPMDRK